MSVITHAEQIEGLIRSCKWSGNQRGAVMYSLGFIDQRTSQW